MNGVSALFEQVYGLTFRKVYAYFAACFGREPAEDLTQQVFLKLWDFVRRPDFGRPDGTPEPANWQAWVFRVAVNVKNDRLRQKQRRGVETEYEDALQNEAREADPTEAVAVQTAFAALGSGEREILTMKQIGLSSAEMGELLEISDSAARSRLAAAKQSFLRKLQENGVEV